MAHARLELSGRVNCAGAGHLVRTELDCSRIVRATLMGMAYSHTIGTMVTFTFIAVLPYTRRQRSVLTWAVVVVTLVLLGIAGSFIATAFLVLFGIVPGEHYWNLSRQSMQYALPITLGLGVVTGLLSDLRTRLDRSNRMLREGESERQIAVQLATEARLSSLESRVHPHFLFNARNSISSLVREDPVSAERLIERMAALLRFSLDSGSGGFVQLGREMKIVSDYLEIEKARFGARLQFTIDLPAELENAAVLPLSVQTLVENSVKFAVSPRREGGVIAVSAKAEAGMLQVLVWDDGDSFDLASVPVGHGLDNLQGRLHASSGVEAKLVIERRGEGKFVALSMPLRDM